VAYTHSDFSALVRAAVVSPDAWPLEKGIEQARANSWETTVSRMERIVAEAISVRADERRGRRRAVAPPPTARVAFTSTSREATP
jgi:hypothetical protein